MVFLQAYDKSKVLQRLTGETSFGAKAWNGRIVAEWLADTLRRAAPAYPQDFDSGCMTLATFCMSLGRRHVIEF